MIHAALLGLLGLVRTPTVTEVMANPLDEAADEFVEIWNQGSNPWPVAGLSLTDGDALDELVPWSEAAHGAFPDTDAVLDCDTLAPGALALVFELDYGLSGAYDIPAGTVILTTADASICNGLAAATDPLTLFDAGGTADSNAVSTYGTPVPSDIWQDRDDDMLDGIPFDPGDGSSVERLFPGGPDAEYNWQASGPGGTPGTLPQASDSTDLCLSWIAVSPSEPSPGEPLTISACVLNCGAIEVSGAALAVFLDSNADSSAAPEEILQSFNPGLLQPGESDTMSCVTSLAEACWLAGALVSHPDDSNPANDLALAVLIVGDGSWPVISEVLANPLNEDCDEFVELFFPGPGVVDATSMAFTDGDALDQVEPWDSASGAISDPDAVIGSFMPPGTRAVILDSEYATGSQPYDLPPGTLVLTTANTTIGDGLTTTDPLTLYRSGGTGVERIVSTWGTPIAASDPLSCDDDGLDGIPFDPGQDLSVNRIVLDGPDAEWNWGVADPSPGGEAEGMQPGYDLALYGLSPEPPMGQGGEVVTVSAVVGNSGTESLEEGGWEVVLFADADLSGSPGSAEIFYSGCPGAVVSGDTLLFEAGWPSQAGGMPLSGWVTCPFDTTSANDSAFVLWNRTLDLVINEVMYGPSPGEPEWIELFNAADQPLDVSLYLFSDSRSTVEMTDTPAVLAPGQFAVVTSDSGAFRDAWPDVSCPVLQPEDWPVLNNQTQQGEEYADDLRLSLASGQVCDYVPYDDSWGGGGGLSLERVSPAFPGYLQSSWTPSATGGTPGEVNDAFSPGQGGGLMSLYPDPFSPDGDGFDDVLTIELALPGLSNTVDLVVYNVQGRVVRTLMDSQQCGQLAQLSWDGTGDGGARLPIGRYIIYLRAEPEAGEVVEAAKVVVLARRM